MTKKRPESRKLKLAPISEDLACPSLLTSSNDLLPRLLSSFSGALGISVALCGVLASIAISQHLIQLVSPSSPALTTYLDKSTNEQSKEAEPTPQAHSRNVLTLPSPIQRQARVSASPTHLSPNLVPIPAPKHTSIEFLEELEFENPFAEEALATKPTRPSLKDKKAEEQKRMALQRAVLAKKKSKNATLISRVTPSYPKSAKRKNIQGRVIVMVTIGTKGYVLGSKIRQSSGDPSLDLAALSASKKFRFSAAMNGLGQPIASSTAIPFNFQLR